MEEKRAMTVIYFLVSWAVALGSPAVPSAAAYNWTFLVFRPTAKMVRFIKSNCAGASLRGAWPARQVPKWAREPRARWNWIWFDGQFYSIRHTTTAITENLQVWNYCKIVELWSKKKDGVGQKVMLPGGSLILRSASQFPVLFSNICNHINMIAELLRKKVK